MIIRTLVLFAALSGMFTDSARQQSAPLTLKQTVPLRDIKSGDFDHFALDLGGNRLFLTGEENHSIELFDLKTNARIRSIKGVDTPHSLLFLPDTNKLFVVDGDGSLKVIDGTDYKVTDSIKLESDADSSAYDASKHLLYVASGGEEAKMDHTLINVVDTAAKQRVADIKVDSENIEAMALEHNGPRLFVNIRDKAMVGVVDREQGAVVATWPLPGVKGNTPIALDEPNHRLFVVSRTPAKLIVLNSDSGSVVTTLPSAPLADDMTFDAASKRIYVACDGFVVVYAQEDADHYKELARIPTSFRAKTAILIPELHRYYVAAPGHGQKTAELRLYDVH